MRLGSLIRAIAVVALTLSAVSPAMGADEGTVNFRLTIRGTPVPTDSFTLGVNADSGLIIGIGIRCGPGGERINMRHDLCAPGDYDAPIEVPVGTELSYAYARYVDWASGGASGAEVLLTGSITVAAYPQTVTLVYDYSLGTVSALPTALPDTRLAPPASSGWGLVGLALLGGAILAVKRQRARPA